MLSSATDREEIFEEQNKKVNAAERITAVPLVGDSTNDNNSLSKSQGLLICGASLPPIFKNEELTQIFAEILPNMKSIIVYRSSPS